MEKTEAMAWVKGGASPNKLGRPLSAKTPRGMLRAFHMKKFTVNELSRLYDVLQPAQQLEFYQISISYLEAKPNPDNINTGQIDQLYDMMKQFVNQKKHG